MATDPNDPAYMLAQAALDAWNGDLDVLDRAFKKLKPTTLIFARAYTLCLSTPPFSGAEATRLILNASQYALAEKIGRRLNVLTVWLVLLTLALVIFGGFDIYRRLRGCG